MQRRPCLLSHGLRRFICGLGKKVIIANVMGQTADAVFGAESGALNSPLAWLGAVAFGAFFEIIQIIVPKRTFDPVDINQNMVGAVTGLIIAYVLWTIWKRIAHLSLEKS